LIASLISGHAQGGDHVDEVLEAAAVAVERGDHDVSPGSRKAWHAFSSGRSAFLPDFLSAKIFRHPAAVRASSCRSSFCPPVETRACPILISVRTSGSATRRSDPSAGSREVTAPDHVRH